MREPLASVFGTLLKAEIAASFFAGAGEREAEADLGVGGVGRALGDAVLDGGDGVGIAREAPIFLAQLHIGVAGLGRVGRFLHGGERGGVLGGLGLGEREEAPWRGRRTGPWRRGLSGRCWRLPAASRPGARAPRPSCNRPCCACCRSGSGCAAGRASGDPSSRARSSAEVRMLFQYFELPARMSCCSNGAVGVAVAGLEGA